MKKEKSGQHGKAGGKENKGDHRYDAVKSPNWGRE